MFGDFNLKCQVNDNTFQKGTNLSSDVTQISQSAVTASSDKSTIDLSIHKDAKKQLADNNHGLYCSQDIQWPSEHLR